MKIQNVHNDRFSATAKIRVFLWTIGQWLWIRRTINKFGFIQACKRWDINPTALSQPNATISSVSHYYQQSCSIHRMVLRAGKCFPNKRSNCLSRALAAAYWMQKYDIPYQIRIGIRSEDETVLTSAHAWIEVNGRPIGELKESIEQLKPLAPYPNKTKV